MHRPVCLSLPLSVLSVIRWKCSCISRKQKQSIRIKHCRREITVDTVQVQGTVINKRKSNGLDRIPGWMNDPCPGPNIRSRLAVRDALSSCHFRRYILKRIAIFSSSLLSLYSLFGSKRSILNGRRLKSPPLLGSKLSGKSSIRFEESARCHVSLCLKKAFSDQNNI